MTLKTNGYQIEVHGFNSKEEMIKFVQAWNSADDGEDGLPFMHDIRLYQGKLSDVTEEQAFQWVRQQDGGFTDYETKMPFKEFVLDSLKSAVSKEFIIVTKTKVK